MTSPQPPLVDSLTTEPAPEFRIPACESCGTVLALVFVPNRPGRERGPCANWPRVYDALRTAERA